jgi:hypothetical protein
VKNLDKELELYELLHDVESMRDRELVDEEDKKAIILQRARRLQ